MGRYFLHCVLEDKEREEIDVQWVNQKSSRIKCLNFVVNNLNFVVNKQILHFDPTLAKKNIYIYIFLGVSYKF